MLGKLLTELVVFHVPTASWSLRPIKGTGPQGLPISCFKYLPVQKMLAGVAHVKNGFHLYFLDTQTCEWKKLIKCTDIEAKLLPNPQLLCDGDTLFVLLSSASGKLHFLCVDCSLWQLSLAPVHGTFPCTNARQLVSLTMNFPWAGTLVAMGMGLEDEGNPSHHSSTSSKAVHVYMLKRDKDNNSWSWCPNRASIADTGPVLTSFTHSSQFLLCTASNLHSVDLFYNPCSKSKSNKLRRI
jgi:hypothetical protein